MSKELLQQALDFVTDTLSKVSLSDAAADELDGLRYALDDAIAQPDWLLSTTQDLAKNIARRCYPEVTQFEVLGDLAGVISQIDNMTIGMERIAQPVQPAESNLVELHKIKSAQPVQPAPVRQPLTDAEITSLAYDCDALPEVVTDKTLIDFVRAIEAAIAQPEQPCRCCNGHGEVGGLRSDGYHSEICPYCKGCGTEQIEQPASPVQAEPVMYQERTDLRGPYSSFQGWTDWRECDKEQYEMIKDHPTIYYTAQSRALIEAAIAQPVRPPSTEGPEEIWLQLHGDCSDDELSEPVDYTNGVSWCWHSINDSDVRYVRADLAQPVQPAGERNE